mgnify:CR=1 FL=1
MVDRDTDKAEEEIVNELDAVLPGGVDRRKFLSGAMGTIGAMMFAGCSGDGGNGGGNGNGNGGGNGNGNGGGNGNGNGGGNGNGNGGDEFMDEEEVVFTASWKKEPTHGPIHVAELEGYWEDEGVPNVDAQAGNGSDTESLNIGTGTTEMGYASFATAISVWDGGEEADALNMSLVGNFLPRPLLALIYRTDEVSGPADLAGKDVLLASGFASATWRMYPQLAGVDPSEISTRAAGEEVGPPTLANNDVQAVWGSIDLLTAYEAEADVELGVVPLTQFGAIPGQSIWVNNDWYENKENSEEFMAAVLTGFHKSLKWVLLNGDAYLDIMKNEVNPNLQTWTEEELRGQYETFSAVAVNTDYRDERIGYFTEEGVKVGRDGAANALLDDPSVVPEASELVNRAPFEASEPVEFTDDEWDQVAETGGRFAEIFAEAESGN